jgi:hypothetical protein
MKFIKQLIIATLITFTVSSAFANKMTIKFNKSMLHEIFNWEIVTQDNGMFFLLGPESTNTLEIHVNNTTVNGKAADPVTVYCNATNYRVESGSSLTCYGNFNDVISMYTAPQDFKNGSKGTYEYKPISS